MSDPLFIAAQGIALDKLIVVVVPLNTTPTTFTSKYVVCVAFALRIPTLAPVAIERLELLLIFRTFPANCGKRKP